MPSEQFLPGPVETAVLHRLGLVRTDEFPDLAARWLAEDVVDTETVRMLAGHDRNDPWGLEAALYDVVAEAGVAVPDEPGRVELVAVTWVRSRWRETGDTRWAVGTLARLGEAVESRDVVYDGPDLSVAF